MNITKPTAGTCNTITTTEGKFEIRYDEYNKYTVQTPRGYTENCNTLAEVKKIITQ